MDDLPTDQTVDDAALFASVTGSEPAPAAEPRATPAIATVPTTPEISQSTKTEPTTEPVIPPSRLREESEARRSAERERDDLRARLERFERAQQPQAQQEAPKSKDFWDTSPEAFVDERLNPVQDQIRSVVLTYSRREAVRDHGQEKVDAAEEALKQAIASRQINGEEVATRLKASLDPVGDVVKWHSRQSTIQKVGDDPDKWFEAELAKRKADPAFQAEMIALAQSTANGGAAPVVERPQSVATTSLRSIGTTPSPATAAAGQSDAELFASTTSRRRRA